jgi:hypothetical protein
MKNPMLFGKLNDLKFCIKFQQLFTNLKQTKKK